MCDAEDETRGADAIELYGTESQAQNVQGELEAGAGTAQKWLGGVCKCAYIWTLWLRIVSFHGTYSQIVAASFILIA